MMALVEIEIKLDINSDFEIENIFYGDLKFPDKIKNKLISENEGYFYQIILRHIEFLNDKKDAIKEDNNAKI